MHTLLLHTLFLFPDGPLTTFLLQATLPALLLLVPALLCGGISILASHDHRPTGPVGVAFFQVFGVLGVVAFLGTCEWAEKAFLWMLATV